MKIAVAVLVALPSATPFVIKASSSRVPSFIWSSYGQDDQVVEAVESLVNYHEGTWSGKARSFTVVPDVAAGIVKRKKSPDYKVSAKIGLNIKERDFSLTETFSWDEDKISSRTLSLNECNVDVDSVDASYSLDATLPDFPSGSDLKGWCCRVSMIFCGERVDGASGRR